MFWYKITFIILILIFLLLFIFNKTTIARTLILCFILFVYSKLIESDIKEPLTLPTYANLYVSAVENSIITKSINNCDNIKIDVTSMDADAQSAISPISLKSADIDAIDVKLTREISVISDVPSNLQTNETITSTVLINTSSSVSTNKLGLLKAGEILKNIVVSGKAVSYYLNILSSQPKLYIQLRLINDNILFWSSNSTYVSDSFTKNINSGNSYDQSYTYTVDFPVTIPENTYLYISIGPYLGINGLTIKLQYENYTDGNSLYNNTLYINTAIVNQVGATNQFLYNNSQTYNIVNKNVLVAPENSALNMYIVPNTIKLNTIYNNAFAKYVAASTKVNLLNIDLDIIKTNLASLTTALSELTIINSNLNMILTSLTSENTLLSNATQIAQYAVNNATNTSIDSAYADAQTKLDSVLKDKNIAYDNLQTALTQGSEQTVINSLQSDYNDKLETYKQAYHTVRFLSAPENLLNDNKNVSSIESLNSILSKAESANTILKYFIDNKLNVNNNSDIFTSLSNNMDNAISEINNANTYIDNMFNTIIPTIKTNANDALLTCTSTQITLTNLITMVTTNIDTVKKLISTVTSEIDTVNSFITNTETTIAGFNNTLINIHAKLDVINRYTYEYFNRTKSYYSPTATSFLTIGTIKNTGKLVRVYLFANMYSWYTCPKNTYFNLSIKNYKTSDVTYNKKILVTNSTGMTLEFLSSDLSLYVNSGDTVNISVIGSSLTCAVSSSNIQLKLDIST